MESQCRACLSTECLFSWDTIVAEDTTYAELFFHVTNLSRNNLEQFQWLCEDCGMELQKIFDFIQKATEAERTLIEIEREHEREAVTQAEDDSNDLQSEDEDMTTLEKEFPAEEIKFEVVDVLPKDNNLQEDVTFEYEMANEQNVTQSEDVDKPFICDYCGKGYSSIHTKKRHYRTVHCKETLLCDACPRTFRNELTLKKHKKTHQDDRPKHYACQQCDLKFLAPSALREHVDTHNEKRVKRHPCDQCDKAFFQKGALNIHKRIHTGDLVQCEICAKRYPRLVDLENHMRTHTGVLPFKCQTCDKSFKYRSSLYDHVRKVHFGYIYKCQFCSKQYQDKQSLVEHSILHKNSLFKCALCDKEMPKRYRLRKHIKNVHKIENPQELEEMIISCKAEKKHRIMRKFTDVEYKEHIAQPGTYTSSSSLKNQTQIERQETTEEQSTDDSETEQLFAMQSIEDY